MRFLEQIAAVPADDAPRLVYADWLEEMGDPRADYLRAEVAVHRTSGADAIAARKRLRAARAKAEPGWLASMEQPGVLRANPTPFEPAWWSIGLDVRPAEGTYGSWPYATLPPLPVPLREKPFASIERAPVEEGAEDGEHWARLAADLRSATNDAERMGFVIPPSFRAYFASPRLPARMRSCTACWFSISPLMPSPGDDGAMLLRFYSDQQGCIHWYLHLTPEGSHCVVSGFEPYEDDEEEFDAGEEPPHPPTAREPFVPHVSEAWFAAPTFEAFIQRFWLENEIWYAKRDDAPLTAEQRAYLAHYEKKGAPE